MRALDRKLFRDLWHIRGQALAIALVIASGVATVIMSLSTLDSLRLTRERYYQDYGFAQVFASLKRAPESLAQRIAEIPGVQAVETRVVAPVTIDIEGFNQPITGQLISVPDHGAWRLNRLYLRAGRMPEPGRADEVLVSEEFGESHGFRPGDHLSLIVNGRKKTLTIVGLALSPEFIYQIAPGTVFPDYKRFSVMWMNRTPLEAAYDMEDGFNDVLLSLARDTNEDEVITRLDTLLEPYGGLGAYARKDQTSHHFLSEEFKQLEQMGGMFSFIFLGVSAFLLNMVVGRLVSTEREQIAALKAFGYSNLAVGLHYVKLVTAIVLGGVAGGVIAGIRLGKGLSNLYMDYYRFPFLVYELRPGIVVGAALVTLAAALVGTLFSVRRAAQLPPAQAMRAEPPPVYRATLIERLGLQRWLAQPTRMILRHVERRPFRAFATILGIALACGIMILGTFFMDAVDYMVEIEYRTAQREDMTVNFVEPTSYRAIDELASLPGVQRVEPFRSVPVRFRFENRSYRTVIYGYEPDPDLHRALDTRLRPLEFPPEGLVMTDYLGKILGLKPGDDVIVEVLEGSRPRLSVPVVTLVKQFIGVTGYMDLAALNRLMEEGSAISGAYLAVDEPQRSAIYQLLKERPRVAGTEVQEYRIQNYYASIGEVLLTFVTFIGALAGVVTFGVVYNTARITLAERGRELASLRVLGLTRGEISYILLGELALLTLIAIPLGFVIGHEICRYFVASLQQDLFRVPLILERDTYALAAVVVFASALASGLIVRHRLDHLDLIAVLKTKE